MDAVSADPPSAVAAEPVDVAAPTDVVTIDPEDERVVPEALTRLVATARFTLRAVEINASYPALDAVAAMEQTTEVLHRLGGHFDLYVGDFSAAGGTAMRRARDLLRQVRSELSDARNHLTIDSESSPVIQVIEAEPIGV
ncbi:hypothetical protein [Actinoplanes aureus]|uniref:Uncharacterized protein n=1 Tax=Actinoplanes aureus TaxID=2792083 RepID=A0A931G4Q8_9ACTN|nr:hypothetical protein [Actinoplanes aureus]MBG0568201.1 hypothetical protein [Actinoplanes aureus]